MHIVDTTQHTWDLIAPNTRGGSVMTSRTADHNVGTAERGR